MPSHRRRGGRVHFCSVAQRWGAPRRGAAMMGCCREGVPLRWGVAEMGCHLPLGLVALQMEGQGTLRSSSGHPKEAQADLQGQPCPKAAVLFGMCPWSPVYAGCFQSQLFLAGSRGVGWAGLPVTWVGAVSPAMVSPSVASAWAPSGRAVGL